MQLSAKFDVADASFPQGRRVDPLLEPFNGEACKQLCRLRLTVIAERSLVPRGMPCPDHQACRRLAFALWLRSSGRLSDEHPPETIEGL